MSKAPLRVANRVEFGIWVSPAGLHRSAGLPSSALAP